MSGITRFAGRAGEGSMAAERPWASSSGPGRSWAALQESIDLKDLGLLALRVSVGFEFLAHGLQKFGRFGGTFDLDGNEVTGVKAVEAQADFLGFLQYDAALFLSWVLTITELVAGALLILGFLVPLAVAAMIADMFQIIFNLQWDAGMFGDGASAGGYEYAVILLVAAGALALTGPGRYSVDRALGWRLHGFPAGVAGIALGFAAGAIILAAFGPGFGGIELPEPPAA
jgi:putative oxidoreductase